ncbi:WSC domain-containing protein 1-like, partial [Eurytemora carolleeae]|uniref:WSC domain-containing protein 1-like n=1 Tax=Eurytemora carolleeae TaxID=1294199 RepID=UPI000C78DAA5
MRALASYPGSGNTWIRYLIEGASGIFTGSIFVSTSITDAGHLGELRNFRDGSTILQKTHHRAIYPYGYRQAVVVVRNPFNSILSYWNFYKTGSQTASADRNSLLSKEFQDFAFVGINHVYFVFYEDLKDDPVEEIKALFDHLGIELDLNRLECIKKHLTGKFQRKNHVEENLYSFDHQALYKLVIDAASKRIEEKT